MLALLVLGKLQRRAQAFVGGDVGRFDVADLVEDAVGQVDALILDGDGAVRVIVDPDPVAPQPLRQFGRLQQIDDPIVLQGQAVGNGALLLNKRRRCRGVIPSC